MSLSFAASSRPGPCWLDQTRWWWITGAASIHGDATQRDVCLARQGEVWQTRRGIAAKSLFQADLISFGEGTVYPPCLLLGVSTATRDAAWLREGRIALWRARRLQPSSIDLIGPPVPLLEPPSHGPPARREILHFAKIAPREKNFASARDDNLRRAAGGLMMRLVREGPG